MAQRTQALVAEGAPEDLARRLAALPDLVAAPDIVLAAQRTGRPADEVARIAFRRRGHVPPRRDGRAQRGPSRSADSFDRLALDRAIDSIAAAHRRLTAEVIGHGRTGPEAVAAWSAARGAEARRIRAAVEAIFASGLTLSKLTVAASLLGDLARE